ncbi:hypothetical protein LSCM1_04390 [Leishmania martiniquensis]|uniref:Uncharacterized protein n=1 Tax=Leishmania martiniquensis TaxID=1580590 RepID=A0A836GXK3_9TRYP|nr:hypothetical protein LSCM1_04390 [Leishmania martiniquensis]
MMKGRRLTGPAAVAAVRLLSVKPSFSGRRAWRPHCRAPLLVTSILAATRHLTTTDASNACTAATPRASPTSEAAAPSSKASTCSDELPPIIDTPAPPRPAFYVPPEERDPSDESLAFLKPGRPLQHLVRHNVEVEPPEGLERAPSLAERQRAAPTYMDADAARVRSTSVHAGQSLLRRSGIDTSAYYYSAPHPLCAAEETGPPVGALDASHRSRLHILREHTPRGELETAPPGAEPATSALSGGRDGAGSSGSIAKDQSIFAASHEFATLEKIPQELEDGRERAAPKPMAKQLEADIKKLEYYQGTPQYDELLADFRAKYGVEGSAKGGAKGPVYTANEVEHGLEGQPIDYHRLSTKLQSKLLSGPRAYDPVTIMQQHGVLRFQGYAFPPTVELGKLKGDGDELRALHNLHKSHPLVEQVRRGMNALVGREDARDDYVAMESKSKEDTHLLYRTFGLEAVQRRQIRYMLTDFDHADRNTTFHVMMSYPYTDWIHVFYMMLVGWCLYQLQVSCGAYDFYDEYLGLDLRQVPRLQKPVLAGVTIVVMIFFFFQPLLVASIATTRVYRIVMKRPIGPP